LPQQPEIGKTPERRLDALNQHLKQDPGRVQLAGLFGSSGRRGEVLDIGVIEQKLGKGPGGVLPDCMLPAASRIRVARALSSRHAKRPPFAAPFFADVTLGAPLF
jgi:hypothetical protein